MWGNRYFALWVKIHGAECCCANPQKLELIRISRSPVLTDETKELMLPNMTHEMLHHAYQYMLGHFLGNARV
jgi:hypothetical protein